MLGRTETRTRDRICFQTIRSVRDISRDDRARIATCLVILIDQNLFTFFKFYSIKNFRTQTIMHFQFLFKYRYTGLQVNLHRTLEKQLYDDAHAIMMNIIALRQYSPQLHDPSKPW